MEAREVRVNWRRTWTAISVTVSAAGLKFSGSSTSIAMLSAVAIVALVMLAPNDRDDHHG